MNDRVTGYAYPEIVKFQVDQNRLESYAEAANYINSQDLDLVCVQHEYGIYGGQSGSYLLNLLREVKVPIVTTLHTILEDPNSQQREVLCELGQLSERLIVMSKRGRSMLQRTHGIDPDKIKVIHHGIPTIEKSDPAPYLERFGLKGKKLILTFGLIAPDKGIQHMILAMPSIVERHPDAHYLVVGATHPHIKAHSGEEYRESLIDLTAELCVSNNVSFIDEFVPLEQLTDYLRATSIYVTPYLKKEQITSGTLAYAYGSGRAVVSTPYWHAEELLADGRGILVPFKDPQALAREVGGLLDHPDKLAEMQERAFEEGREMLWPVIGEEYVMAFDEAKEASRTLLPAFAMSVDQASREVCAEEDLGLDHLLALVDDTGIIQHATYCVPNRWEGYCTDDNARLAIVGARLEEHPAHTKLALSFQMKGLAFMQHAFNPQLGRLRNFMGYDRQWLENIGSEDSHGRAMWALGTLCDESSSTGIVSLAKELMLNCLPAASSLTSLRSMSFAILGLDRFWRPATAKSRST